MPELPTGRPTTSTRDVAELLGGLRAWLQQALASDTAPEVTLLGGPSGAGLSSETVLFDVAYQREGEPGFGRYALRLPPPPDAFPLFPRYDLERQARVMRLVRERSSVEVPAVPWFEPDTTTLGVPFMVMERADGVVASDMPPYVFGGWLLDASEAEQRRVEAGMVRILAGIHDVDLADEEAGFLDFPVAGRTPLERHVANQWAYYEWISDHAGARFPIIERTFAQLRSSWPVEGPAAISWGDARLANVMFDDFEPAAVLDWEAAALAPREVDLGWLVFFHRYFQRVAERFDHKGMPEFMQCEAVVAAYQDAAGYQINDFEWYLLYAELRQALTSIRVSSRAVHFGERDMPDDPQDLILDREHLEEVVR